ncbi:MAG TPA: sodium:proton antiporter NhaD [Candidatus Onthomorpha intestinigallinarum]|uniref:Sodium:proton antiporter NhaD n=1 Tax=Candidatus Onthomorpha intestinigallinarum TaxID=2840880 RepID=A0A9D1RFL4_9BACT|nr:sodium:proton antiporter NhaD [Candidatus Onthomorpha intestinigallinarum]
MIIIFIVGYAMIALEHPLKINKSATALLLAAVIWAVYALMGPGFDHESLIGHLGETAEILFFLLGAMTIVEIVDRHDGFSIITDRITTTNKKKLLWIISILTFFMSAVLDNLTTAIVICALLRKLIQDQKTRWFFCGMVILAANAGGAWSPIGDVTTIMLWIKGNITAGKIILETFLPALVSMLVPLAIISFTMKGNVERPKQNDEAAVSSISKKQSKIILCMGVGLLLFVPVFKTITHLPPYLGILLGLGILWVTTEIMHKNRPEIYSRLNVTSIIQRVDTPSVLFFLGILMAVSCLNEAGHLKLLAESLDKLGNVYVINLIIGVLSSIIDNVPLVAAAMGMYPIEAVGHFAVDGAFWEGLAYCAGTGGSLLIIGSAAGVAIMGMEKIDFIWYLKKITLWALLGYLAGAGVFYLMSSFILHT